MTQQDKHQEKAFSLCSGSISDNATIYHPMAGYTKQALCRQEVNNAYPLVLLL
jgi:hypothetical protein